MNSKPNNMQVLWKMMLALLIAACLKGQLHLTASAESGQFSVKAVIPENQVDKKQTYFDLRLSPGEKQTIQVEVKNFSTEKLEATVALNAAATSRNGLIVYNQPDIRDESMAVSITDIAKVRNPQLVIPAGKTAMAEIDLEMPPNELSGVVLGGLVVTGNQPDDSIVSQISTGIQLNNEYAYVIGLKVDEADVVPDADFHLKSITPGLVNYRTALVVNLQNDQPRIVKKMQVTGEVYNKNDQLIHDLYLANAEMAPSSNGDFVIDWDNKELQAGDYRLYLKVEYEGDVWEWDQAFEIPSNVAYTANNDALGLDVQQSSRLLWSILIGIFLLVLILIFVAYYFGRRSSRR